jgi:hypothetical protein
MTLSSLLGASRRYLANRALKSYLHGLTAGLEGATRPWDISREEIRRVEVWIGQGANYHQTSLIADQLVLAPELMMELLKRNARVSTACLERILSWLINRWSASMIDYRHGLDEVKSTEEWMSLVVLELWDKHPDLDWFIFKNNTLFMQELDEHFSTPFRYRFEKKLQERSLIDYLADKDNSVKQLWVDFLILQNMDEDLTKNILEEILVVSPEKVDVLLGPHLISLSCVNANWAAFKVIHGKGIPIQKEGVDKIIRSMKIDGTSDALKDMLKLGVIELGHNFDWDEIMDIAFASQDESYREFCETYLNDFNQLITQSEKNELDEQTLSVLPEVTSVRRL